MSDAEQKLKEEYESLAAAFEGARERKWANQVVKALKGLVLEVTRLRGIADALLPDHVMIRTTESGKEIECHLRCEYCGTTATTYNSRGSYVRDIRAFVDLHRCVCDPVEER